MRNVLLGGGTLLASACLFLVRFSTSQTHTLVAAIGQLVSGNPHDVFMMLVTVPCCLIILLTIGLPPVLWLELAVAPRPLSRRTRFLLIGQGLVGFVGVVLTAACMLIMSLNFGFGADASSDPAAGFYVILASEAMFALASLFLGLQRAPTPAAATSIDRR
jgi:hypothetical protein